MKNWNEPKLGEKISNQAFRDVQQSTWKKELKRF